MVSKNNIKIFLPLKTSHCSVHRTDLDYCIEQSDDNLCYCLVHHFNRWKCLVIQWSGGYRCQAKLLTKQQTLFHLKVLNIFHRKSFLPCNKIVFLFIFKTVELQDLSSSRLVSYAFLPESCFVYWPQLREMNCFQAFRRCWKVIKSQYAANKNYFSLKWCHNVFQLLAFSVVVYNL